ncbi:MAG: GFA family protein [Pseudomonadota bacterium]
MKVTGSCLCGAIVFEAEANPERVLICHCTDCQKSSGSAFRTILPVRADRFTLLKGEPREFVKTAQSGARRPQVFCADCGTHLYGTGEGEAARVLGLRAGLCDERAELIPKREIWCQSALAWVGELGTQERNEQG